MLADTDGHGRTRTWTLGLSVWVVVLCAVAWADVNTALVSNRCSITGDGVTDVTEALQACLDDCGARGGGIVSLPTGDYIVRGHLFIPDFVTLQGVFRSPTAWSQGEGTTLNAFEGRGSEEGPPFILMGTCATLQGVTIFYPEQSADEVVPYPWCIAGNGGDNVTVMDCLLVNPYLGIDLATHNSGRHFISRVYGYPLRCGIAVDQCYDIGRIENVHFWPFWEGASGGAVRRFVQENGEAFVFGRTDWQYVFNTFCFGYRIGYRFVETPSGVCNGNFLGIGADSTNVAVQVDQCSPIGLQITNGEFVSFEGVHPTELVVDAANIGTVLLNNCSFWGPSWNCARISGNGYVGFEQCNFRDWDAGNVAEPCIVANGGSLTVNACRFDRDRPGIRVEEGAAGAVITSNTFGQRDTIDIARGVHAEVANNFFPGEGVWGCAGGTIPCAEGCGPGEWVFLVTLAAFAWSYRKRRRV